MRAVLALFCVFLPFLTRAATPVWTSEAGFRFLEVSPPASGKSGFTLLPAGQTGIAFTNELPVARYRTNQILLNGSGIAAGDVDGDGWCDLYFCGIDRPNTLYRNLGNWRFEEFAGKAGVRCEGLSSTGAALMDFDGDRDLDLIVNSVGHGTRLFLNDGRGQFSLAGVFNQGKGGMSVAAGDLNGDGYLDLYVANYRTQALMDMPNTRFTFTTVDGRRVVSRVNGRPVTEPDLLNRFRANARGGIEESGETDAIYLSVGGTALQPVLFTSGAFLDENAQALQEPPVDWGLSVLIRDLNQDGKPDIWVCNDFDSPDRIWLNQGGGKFRALPKLAIRKSSHFSMGLDVADIDRDGWDDVFVVDMLSRDQVTRMDMMGDRNPPVPYPGQVENRPDYMINTLFLNRGDGTYTEIAQLAGLGATEWSWTPAF
ncbi:MAG TPA: VCBS repeat-containing protein, partial [Verrucomicrobiae bacterium]|nr:VCBS repeat-containing protein [Verrucomicrobiae bacterium]